jgi:hypothetical protein
MGTIFRKVVTKTRSGRSGRGTCVRARDLMHRQEFEPTHETPRARAARPYSGYTLRSPIEAPLITREVLPETYFLLVNMAADAQEGPFLEFQASC